MDSTIALILIQDGIVNGAIYALISMALVLVFAVTRVIFIPQGEFVTFGALTLAMLVNGIVPGTVWLLLAVGIAVCVVEAVGAVRSKSWRGFPRVLVSCLIYPAMMAWLVHALPRKELPLAVNVLLSLALVVPLGPMIYRLAYQRLAEASVLVLLIASVAVHFALTGAGLLFFGAEGWRTPPFVSGSINLGFTTISAQTIFVVVTAIVLICILFLLFEKTLYGRALRATAVNRRGARLMGISTTTSGAITFTLAAFIGAFSGVLIAPVTTIYYDTGFLIGLKGFVGAIFGGLSSYPIAAAGSVFVGLLEAFGSFWASAFKEVIVFTVIIPVLLWLSLTHAHAEDEE